MDNVKSMVETQLQAVDAFANRTIFTYPQAKELHAKAGGVRPAFVVFGAGAVVALLVFLIFDFDFLCKVLAFTYPVFASYKALASPDNPDAAHWLTYWIVFSFVVLTESITDMVFFWVPFYGLFKLAFYVYLMHPATMGAGKIYKMVLEPHFAKLVQQAEAKTE